jgi:hypothetical protein
MGEQNYRNHTKLVPTFHFFVLPVLVLNVVQAIVKLARHWFYWDGLVGVLLALALLIFAFNARLFALCVQDRVIRMEERRRLARLLPSELQSRIAEFTPRQLVALRFASDDELPALARRVLADQITSPKIIKQMVKSWRADYLRA